MKVPWSTVLNVAIGMLDVAIPGVRNIETIARSIGGLRGKQKQDAVVALVKQSLETSENFLARNFADDAEVEAATRGVIDAVVALNNILAQKAAAAA